MMRKKGTHNRIWAIVITVALTVSLLLPLAEYNRAWNKAKADGENGSETKKPGQAAFINYSPGLNVRVGPSSKAQQMTDKNGNLIQLPASTLVRVLEGEDGDEYCKIQFDYHDEKDLVGYVLYYKYDEAKGTEYRYVVEYIEDYRDEAFEAEMDAQGFPESYREILRAVHQYRPLWKFVAQHVDIDWNTAVTKEYNLWPTVNQKYESSWKSTDTSDYRYAVDDGEGGLKDGGWVLKDGKYNHASREMLSYSMDPRNFLAECTLFMFEDLDYDPQLQNEAGVARIISPYKDFQGYIDGDDVAENTSYAAVFMQAAEESKVNPYYLAARSVHEVNNSLIISGQGIDVTVNGVTQTMYKNLYNYYNFNAYADSKSGRGVIENGLYFASLTSEREYRPWNTRKRAIIGGAIRIADTYVSVGQNTPYLQRYNVAPKNSSNRYSHQYMSLVTALYEESQMYYNGLMNAGAEVLSLSFEFLIPIYKNMPETPCVRPVGDGNPNGYLKSLTVTSGEQGMDLTPGFTWNQTYYTLIVDETVESVTIAAAPLATATKISGTGTVRLEGGENLIYLDCLAGNGTNIRYTVNIFRKAEGITPTPSPSVSPTVEATPTVTPKPTGTPTNTPIPTDSPTPTPTPEIEIISSETFLVSEKQISNIALGTDVSTMLAGLSVTGDGAKVLYNAKGETVTEGLVGTGYTLKTRSYSIPIVIYGDVDGDGEVTAKDLLYVRRHILGITTLQGAMAVAADVKDADGINAVDMLYIRRQLLGIAQIEQKR